MHEPNENQQQELKAKGASRKRLSDGKIKAMCMVAFLLVAAGGIFLNLNKTYTGLGINMFGLSSLWGGGGGTSIEDQRREIMESDLSDGLKALKLQALSSQK
jgi:hypothetical protein